MAKRRTGRMKSRGRKPSKKTQDTNQKKMSDVENGAKGQLGKNRRKKVLKKDKSKSKAAEGKDKSSDSDKRPKSTGGRAKDTTYPKGSNQRSGTRKPSNEKRSTTVKAIDRAKPGRRSKPVETTRNTNRSK